MKKINFKIKNVKLAFAILIILAFILLLLYYHFVLSPSFAKNNFANQMIEISDENEDTIFSIQKVVLYSSADAIDNSDNQSLENMSVCQYSDLSIYLNNSESDSELTDENTVKELYIDNISIASDIEKELRTLNYKNPLHFGKYIEIQKPENDRIDFKIITTNEQNENHNYDEPTFYTDCSNPISLGYIYKDILTNYSVTDNSKTVSFNGKLLKEANINLEEINCSLNFTIHVVNNLNQSFAYNMNLDINLNEDIYNGYLYKGKTTSGDEYRFIREVL